MSWNTHQFKREIDTGRETVRALGNEDHLVSKIERLLKTVQTPGV